MEQIMLKLLPPALQRQIVNALSHNNTTANPKNLYEYDLSEGNNPNQTSPINSEEIF